MHRDLLSLIHKKLIPQSARTNYSSLGKIKNFINFSSISNHTLAMNTNINWKKLVLALEERATHDFGDIYLVEAKTILEESAIDKSDNDESDNDESDIENVESKIHPYVKDHYIGLPYGEMLKTISWENYYYFLSILLYPNFDDYPECLDREDDYTYIDPDSLWYPFVYNFLLDEQKFIAHVYPAIWNEEALVEEPVDKNGQLTGLFKTLIEYESDDEFFDFIYGDNDDHRRLKFEYNRDIINYLINYNEFALMDKYVERFPDEMRKGFIEDILNIYEFMASSRNMKKWLEWMKNNLHILPKEDIYFAVVFLYDENIVDNDSIISLLIWLKNNKILPSDEIIFTSIEFAIPIIKWISQNWLISKKMRKQWYLFEDFENSSESENSSTSPKFPTSPKSSTSPTSSESEEFTKIVELIKLGIVAPPDNNILYNLDYYGKDELLKFLKEKYRLTYVPSGTKMRLRELFNSKNKRVANPIWWPNKA